MFAVLGIDIKLMSIVMSKEEHSQFQWYNVCYRHMQTITEINFVDVKLSITHQ
jgi:hypothetical protein